MVKYSYRRDLKIGYDALIRVRDKIGYILRTLGPCNKAREIGIPSHGDAPLTEELINDAKTAENISLPDKDRLKASLRLNKHYTDYFTETHRFISETDDLTLRATDKLDKKMKNPTVYIRDYNAFPGGNDILRVLSTVFNGHATFEQIKSVLPHHYSDLKEKLERIKNLWRGIITIDPDSNTVYMNDTDRKSWCAQFDTAPIEVEKKQAEMYDKIQTKTASAFYVLHKITEGDTKELCRYELEKYYSQDLSEYPTLIDEDQIQQLRKHNIHTAIEFCNTDYEFLKLNTKLTRAEIIDLKLGLASRIKHDPSNYEIELIHPSVAVNSQISTLYTAIRNLKEYFNKEVVTFEDINKTRPILLNSKECTARRVSYKVVAFIRYFIKECLNSDPWRFNPLAMNWRYSENLTKKEQSNIDLDDSELEKNKVSEKSTENNTTTEVGEIEQNTPGGAGVIDAK